jgi:hypothetical protein
VPPHPVSGVIRNLAALVVLTLCSGCGLAQTLTCSGQAPRHFADRELVEITSRHRSPQYFYSPGSSDPIGRLAQDCCRVERWHPGFLERVFMPPATHVRYYVEIRWRDTVEGRRVQIEYYEWLNACGVTRDTSGQTFYV